MSKAPIHDVSVPGAKTYALAGECTNCNWYGRLVLPFGRKAPLGGMLGGHITCPECGVSALKAVREVPLP